jgi:hypothetical protein
MVRKNSPEAPARGEPAPRQASDPERDASDVDTTAVPGEERQGQRARNEPEPDQDVE